MRRSEINLFIAEAIDFFEANHFSLPSFASWTPSAWHQWKDEDEIRHRQLGWDVTDFGSGTFASCGLTLFTLRNGSGGNANHYRPYAEKIMMVREQQTTPLHYHHSKIEDIINRGGVAATGDLAVQVYQSAENGDLMDIPVKVVCDGVIRHIDAGETIILKPGESITLPPRVYHSFHAVRGNALIGEISSINNDNDDNHFYLPVPRFPEIEEDEPPLRLLCTEYLQSNGQLHSTNFLHRT